MAPLASVDLLLNKYTYKRRSRLQCLSSRVYKHCTLSIVTGLPNTTKLFNIGPSTHDVGRMYNLYICIVSAHIWDRFFDLFIYLRGGHCEAISMAKNSSIQSAWSGPCMGMKPQCSACFYGLGVWFGLIGSGAELLWKRFCFGLYIGNRTTKSRQMYKCTAECLVCENISQPFVSTVFDCKW